MIILNSSPGFTSSFKKLVSDAADRLRKQPMIKGSKARYDFASAELCFRHLSKKEHILHKLIEMGFRVSITPNGSGEYETSADLQFIGVVLCPDCGYPQAIELKQCKGCANKFIVPCNETVFNKKS